MPTSEEYQRKAEECRRLAELAADERERASHIRWLHSGISSPRAWRKWKPPKRRLRP